MGASSPRGGSGAAAPLPRGGRSATRRGGGVPFRRISGDPSDENDDLTSTYDENDPEAWKPFFLGLAGGGLAETLAVGVHLLHL